MAATPLPLHLSIPVADLEAARRFYVDLLGCTVGRTEAGRFDFDFFGHHVVAHHHPEEAGRVVPAVDAAGDLAPVRHFGAVLDEETFAPLAQKLKAAGCVFTVEPHVARPGTPGEQWIMMVSDGAGNAVEFKGMPRERLFAR